MATVTAQGTPVPQLGDAPNVPADMLAAVQSLELGIARNFASTATRDTGIPSPVAWQQASVGGVDWQYNGSGWARKGVGAGAKAAGYPQAYPGGAAIFGTWDATKPPVLFSIHTAALTNVNSQVSFTFPQTVTAVMAANAQPQNALYTSYCDGATGTYVNFRFGNGGTLIGNGVTVDAIVLALVQI